MANRVNEMAASNFRPSLALVLAHEGGYVNHPADPGGPTNHGVTQKVYDAFRRYNAQSPQSVRDISPSEVSDIYNKNYWRLVRGDSLPCGLDYAVFDFAVNSGVNRAVRYLQRLVGVPDDGAIGFVTLTAIEARAKASEESFIAQYCANRMAFLRSLGTFPTFGLGWSRRVMGYRPGVQADDNGVIDFATMMARRDSSYPLPAAIGSLANEPQTAKAEEVTETDNTFVEAPQVKTATEAKALLPALMASNDELAAKI